MLFDEQYRLGVQHAKSGAPRYKWSNPHLQAAYDKGYDGTIHPKLNACRGCGKQIFSPHVYCNNCI